MPAANRAPAPALHLVLRSTSRPRPRHWQPLVGRNCRRLRHRIRVDLPLGARLGRRARVLIRCRHRFLPGRRHLPFLHPRLRRITATGLTRGVERLDRLVQFVRIQVRRREGIAPSPVRQGQLGRAPNIVARHLGAPFPGRDRRGRLVHHDVRAMAVHPHRDGDVNDQRQHLGGYVHRRQHLPSLNDLLLQFRARPGPFRQESRRVGVVGDPPAHDLGSNRRLRIAAYFSRQPKPVQQLRPQVAFFRVHRADQDVFGRMPVLDPLTFDQVRARGRAVQQRVHQVVVQQVDFVYIQQPAVRRGQ